MAPCARRLAGVLLLVALSLSHTPSRAQDLLSHAQLVEDARELARTIESVHPDPYLRGGGKIAFHRRLHDILQGLPEEGLPRDAFYRRLLPLVASLRDAHTWLNCPYSYGQPRGIPLLFGIAGDELFVQAVFTPAPESWIGSRLRAVQDVPFPELLDRERRIMGADNDYLLLRNMAWTGTLFYRVLLQDLLPEWTDPDRIAVTLEHPDGTVERHELAVKPAFRRDELRLPAATVELPATTRCDFAFGDLDPEGAAVALKIDGMMGYREAFEIWRALGVHGHDEKAGHLHQRYHGTEAPGDLDRTIAALPSATECFRDLVLHMEAKGTKTLLVDLRQNGGGNSYMTEILLYFLYGREAIFEQEARTLEIERYSPEFFDSFDGTLEQANEGRRIPLRLGDYAFESDHVHGPPKSAEQVREEVESELRRMPTFWGEFVSGEHEARYRPANVVVLCSPHTFSSGYTMLAKLTKAGAIVLGTPSAQAGNCFGDILGFTLTHSGLSYTVSRKYFELFPDDPDVGRVLRPHHPMRWEILRDYGFDPDAEVLYALDLAREGGLGP